MILFRSVCFKISTGIRLSIKLFYREKVFNQIHHFIHFNLSLSLLLGLILFVSGIETPKDSRVSFSYILQCPIHAYIC